MEKKKRRILFMCCFCGDTCPGDVQIALIQQAGQEDEHEQFWFCHFGCFERALHEQARIFRDGLGEEEESDG